MVFAALACFVSFHLIDHILFCLSLSHFCPVSCHLIVRHLSYSFILLVHSFMHPALVESQSLLWQDCSWCRRIFSHSRRDSELDHTTSWHRLWIIYHFSHGLLLEPLGFMASERHQTGFSPTENLQISSKGFVVDTLSLSGLLSSIVESPPDETCQDEKNGCRFFSLWFILQGFDANTYCMQHN